ncbi:MAG: HpcH/HpaI aldolase/citrate lyase family protein [Aliihoeflea sp.]|uniref:HpcH/HpaI aldolase/citrate lyase family protein n=1 Tax=Aliihoeflea sp. 40Bstr573 TaxID=2696467 RepID=UPI002095F289|nr:CoA ester lyase [Aliihoeflea sp. 40Bstr573]MCO6386817.1 CoA ester lyase [Aliihoeflea sp. 40Bstr573]
MTMRPLRPRRSVLYVPATNAKALAKIATLSCDAVVIDLEDAVAPSQKVEAREAACRFIAARGAGMKETVLRINALSTEWGRDDLRAAREASPDAVLLPKVDGPRDVLDADRLLDRGDTECWLWAMIETPRAMLNLGAIAELGRDNAARLACLVAGTNDLVKDTGVLATPDRRYLVPWLMQMVLAARAGGLDVLDGVSNDFRNLDAFAAECREGANMGFDGKTLIHPAQIDPANAAFSPGEDAVFEAEAIRAAFALPENRDAGVISLGGKMVERLHLEQAERLLAKAEAK